MSHFSILFDPNFDPKCCALPQATADERWAKYAFQPLGFQQPISTCCSSHSELQRPRSSMNFSTTTIDLGPSQQDLLFILPVEALSSDYLQYLFVEIFQVCAVQHLAQLRKEGVVQFPPTETALMILLRRCGPGPWGLSEVQNVLQGILQIHRYPQLSTVWFHKRVGFTLAENKLGVCEDIGWGCFEPAFTLIFCRGPIISNHLNQWDKGLLAESQEHFLAKPILGCAQSGSRC